MSLESVLVGLASSMAEKLLNAAISGEDIRAIPISDLVKKAEWQKLERAALREAARRRVGG